MGVEYGMGLRGRSVVVVGAGSVADGWGNGKASAVAYARAGAMVLCVDRALERARETADVILAEGGQAEAFAADACIDLDVGAALRHALGTFGRLDVLHNNVGFAGTRGAPHEIAVADWNREITLNLTTAYLGIRHAVPLMQAQGGGAITNISSLLAVRFLRQPSVAYSAAKAAVEGLTRASALAYGRDNIRVNCLRIGFSETPLVRLSLEAHALPPEVAAAEMARSRAKVPLRGEHTNPFEVAAAAVFLASDAARGITGAILNVDGGLECAPV